MAPVVRRLLLLSIFAACSSSPTKHDQCERARDRIIDLRLANLTTATSPASAARVNTPSPRLLGSGSSSASDRDPWFTPPTARPMSQREIDAHRSALKQAFGGAFVKTCEAGYSETQIQCVLDANDSQTVDACSRRGA